MNKTPEQQAEERYPFSDFGGIRLLQTSMNENRERLQKGFVDGYHARDEEVEKLVEVLREVERGQYGELKGTYIARIQELAKEALKPYLK